MAFDDEAANKARDDRLRRRRVFERHAKAAENGIHLPSTRELLLGMPFMGSDLAVDSKAWAERVVRRIRDNDAGKRVRAALEALTVDGLSSSDFTDAIDAIDTATNIKTMSALDSEKFDGQRFRGIEPTDAKDRLYVYAALSGGGDKDCCLRVAQDAIRYARDDSTPGDEVLLFVQAALGFISISLDSFHTWRGGRSRYSRGNAMTSGNELFTLAAMEFESQSGSKASETQPASDTPLGLRDILDGISLGGTDRVEPGAEAARTEPDGIVVVKEIGNATTGEGKRVVESFKAITGIKLPLAPVKNLALVRELLLDEFPYARRVIDSILNPLEGRKYIHLKPAVLIGEPGSGKTTFALRLLQLLEIPSTIYGCGGVSDASAAGTARQWQTGGPAITTSAVLRHRTASVGIVLDELDRVSNNRHNGNFQDALLGLLEPTSAKRWYDPYVMAEVDVSATIYLATSNSPDIPAALRDRMRIIRWPNPGVEHLETLAIDLRDAILEERGLSSDWALPFSGHELDALRSAWPRTGSLRALRRLIEAVLDARDYVGDKPLS